MPGHAVQLDAVEIVPRAREPFPQRERERRRERLVGVERDHPVVLGLVEREVLLLDVSGVGPPQHAGAGALREGLAVVAAALVDHDDRLVGPGERIEAALDVVRVVARDHASADGSRHVRRRSTDRIPLIRPISFITAFKLATSFTHRSKVWIALASSRGRDLRGADVDARGRDRLGHLGEQARAVEAVHAHLDAPAAPSASVSHCTSMRRAGSCSKVFAQSFRCTVTPRPRVTKPITSSPGSGAQQRGEAHQHVGLPAHADARRAAPRLAPEQAAAPRRLGTGSGAGSRAASRTTSLAASLP